MGWVPEKDDDLGVRLEWPADEFQQRPSQGERAPDPDDSAEQPRPGWLSGAASETPESSTELAPYGPDPIEGAVGLAAISVRLDALLKVTATFRNTISDRLSDYADHASRLANRNAVELDEYRRAEERVLGELRRTVSGVSDAVSGMSEAFELMRADAEAQRESIESAVARLADEVRSIRRRTAVQGRARPARLDESQVNEIVGAVVAALTAEIEEPDPRPRRRRVAEVDVDDDDED